MPVAGLTRLRKHQFGRQAVHGTKVAAKRAYAMTGTPSVDMTWEDPEVDAGSIDPTTPPIRGTGDYTASLTLPSLHYNDIPLILSAFFGDAVTPSGAGTAKTWAYAPASATADVFDRFTYEFGDDVTTDWFQLGDGIIESFEITAPEGLGPLSATMTWRFGSAASTGSTDFPVTGTVPTAALTVSTTDPIVYLKDIAIAIASVTGDLGTSQIEDALHSFTLRGSQEIDQKRYANGSQSFDINEYGRGRRTIELEAVWAKTADTVGTGSESDAWMSDTAVNRHVRLSAESLAEAEAATPFSWVQQMPMRYYTRSDGEIGNNTTVTLLGRAFYDPTPGVYTSTVVNTLANAGL
jgi:hypothetical protein